MLIPPGQPAPTRLLPYFRTQCILLCSVERQVQLRPEQELALISTPCLVAPRQTWNLPCLGNSSFKSLSTSSPLAAAKPGTHWGVSPLLREPSSYVICVSFCSAGLIAWAWPSLMTLEAPTVCCSLPASFRKQAGKDRICRGRSLWESPGRAEPPLFFGHF